jgi:hypothetical protein
VVVGGSVAESSRGGELPHGDLRRRKEGAVGTLVSTTDQLVLPQNDRTVDGGDEEDGDEKLHLEHGDVGGVPTGWLMCSKGIHPRFCIFPPLPCELGNPVLDLVLSDPTSDTLPPLPSQECGLPLSLESSCL